jgi:serine/threonine protein kinase
VSQLLKRLKSLSEPDVALYTIEIVLALETLHQMGIVHQDIKLSNILLDSDGRVAVADYGLSKEFDPDKKHQRTYSYCGTNEYMAPEVHRCNINQQNAATMEDLHNVGKMTSETEEAVLA